MKTWKAISLAFCLSLGAFWAGTTYSPEIKDWWINNTASERNKMIHNRNKIDKTPLIYSNPKNLVQAIANYVAENGKPEKGCIGISSLKEYKDVRGPLGIFNLSFSEGDTNYIITVERNSFYPNLERMDIEYIVKDPSFNDPRNKDPHIVVWEGFFGLWMLYEDDKPNSTTKYCSVDHKSKKKSYEQVLGEITKHLRIEEKLDLKTKEKIWTWPDQVWK